MREEEGESAYTMAISILLQRTHLSSTYVRPYISQYALFVVSLKTYQ